MTHICSFRVRTYECDVYQHVNNAVYLHYLEHARQEFLNDAGFDYVAFMEQGFGIFISRISIDYRMGARTNEVLEVHTTPLERRSVSGVFGQVIRNERGVCAEAQVTWVCVNSAGKPVRLPVGFPVECLDPAHRAADFFPARPLFGSGAIPG